MFGACCEESSYKMSTGQNVILRVAIVFAMMVAVVAILYLTPLPEQQFKSCDRPCHDLDWPMICRVKLQIDDIRCDDCNATTPKGDLSVNHQIPGPPIQVCQNDILVVDVTNKVPGHSLTVHWRGQPNNEAPYMDGVPLITQCPIPSYTTFQYKFRASSSGTHLYHAFSDHNGGLSGALVVRQPDKFEPQRKLYDVDSKDHIILISEAADMPLINGKGEPDLAVFYVKRNKRYRFRVAYTGAKCPVTLSVDSHVIKVIALDGNAINPNEADSVVLGKGERVDFILKTNQENGDYFLRAKSCGGDALAVINYEGGRKRRFDLYNVLEKEGRLLDTTLCGSRTGRVCLEDVKSWQKMPEQLQESPGKVAYLSFGSRIVNVNGKSLKWAKRESSVI